MSNGVHIRAPDVFDCCKLQTALHMHSGFTGEGLPTAYRGIDIERVKFEPACHAAGLFGGDERCTRPDEWVEDEAATF